MTAIVLEKGARVSFDKGAAVADITLTWTTNSDPDLGAMWRMTDGTVGVVQALGKTFGMLGKPPFVVLDKDDRSGGQERLSINLARADQIERILVYGTIYHGGSWNNVGDAVVTVRHPDFPAYTIDLGKSNAKSCGLVNFEQQNGVLIMSRLEDFINGTEPDIDRFYGFPNIKWKSGSKD